MGERANSAKTPVMMSGVAIGLLSAPLLNGISPDRFKVALGGGSKAIFSHAR